MNWKMIIGGSIIMVFIITWISAMAIVSGMSLTEFVIGAGIIVTLYAAIVLFLKGLFEYNNGD